MLRLIRDVALLSFLLAGSVEAQTVFVNELHYDNASTDSNEAIEIAGPAGTSLTGWSIALYNGNGGTVYSTINLSGAIPNQCANFGTVSVPAAGIQNGSPDGLALVNGLGQVVQFLSYEGTILATDGPAQGMTSTDIGISENGTGAATSSLQLVGTGTTYADFTWTEATSSFDNCNASQTFVGGVDDPPSILSTSPVDGATGVSPFSNLTVAFSEDVTTAPGWYTLSCSVSGPVATALTGGPRSFTIDPAITLVPEESCALTISAAAVNDLDVPIDPMAQDVTINFVVATDTPPAVTQTIPVQGATSVFVDSNLSVRFSEPVTVQAGGFTLSCTTAGTVALAVSGGPTAYTLDPTVDLDYLDTCNLTVVANLVSDLDGSPNAMAGNVVVTFSTEQSLADYYAPVDTSSAVSLRLTLNAVIDDHTRYPYTASSTDTWDILDIADEDPMNPANVLDVYKNASYPKAGAGNANYNREHRWAKSYGFPDDSSSSWAYTDIHHLIVANSGYNSARNNRYFDHCADSCTEYPTDLTNGVGGGSGVYPGNSNWGKGDRWEVWGFRKGDVARALLYMDVRYEGGTNTFGSPEPDLVLTNNPALIQTTGTNTTGTAYLGLLCVLVEWHRADPPDEQERLRNALVQTFQDNRNPFVDHPEWADVLFNAECPRPDALFQDGFD